MGGLTSEPERLTPDHKTGAFQSGVTALDDWLKRRALHNEREGASRTYVVCAESQVVGYFSLATGSVSGTEVPGRVRRNMPDPIPVMILGRLAVDQTWQGRKLGQSLLSDAIRRTLAVSDIAGIRAILVHAISAEAKRFYERYGFQECPEKPMTLVLMLRNARAVL
jgi:GNAT superfamily N-acetyltransferase